MLCQQALCRHPSRQAEPHEERSLALCIDADQGSERTIATALVRRAALLHRFLRPRQGRDSRLLHRTKDPREHMVL